MARCAAAASSGVSGCFEKWTAVSSWLYVKRFGASSRQRRHNAQLISTYHCPGAFSDCLLSLSATIEVTQDSVGENQRAPEVTVMAGLNVCWVGSFTAREE